jgi:hypothetical protein
MGNEHVNMPNTDGTQRGEINRIKIVTKLVMQKDPTTLSTIHQETP